MSKEIVIKFIQLPDYVAARFYFKEPFDHTSYEGPIKTVNCLSRKDLKEVILGPETGFEYQVPADCLEEICKYNHVESVSVINETSMHYYVIKKGSNILERRCEMVGEKSFEYAVDHGLEIIRYKTPVKGARKLEKNNLLYTPFSGQNVYLGLQNVEFEQEKSLLSLVENKIGRVRVERLNSDIAETVCHMVETCLDKYGEVVYTDPTFLEMYIDIMVYEDLPADFMTEFYRENICCWKQYLNDWIKKVKTKEEFTQAIYYYVLKELMYEMPMESIESMCLGMLPAIFDENSYITGR